MRRGYLWIIAGILVVSFRVNLGYLTLLPSFAGWLMLYYGISRLEGKRDSVIKSEVLKCGLKQTKILCMALVGIGFVSCVLELCMNQMFYWAYGWNAGAEILMYVVMSISVLLEYGFGCLLWKFVIEPQNPDKIWMLFSAAVYVSGFFLLLLFYINGNPAWEKGASLCIVTARMAIAIKVWKLRGNLSGKKDSAG